MRRAARVDENHAEIVIALRKAGCSVLSLAPIGKGAPDLVVGHGGRNTLIEVKRGAGKLNEQQKAFRANWRGDVCVVRSVEEALLVLGLLA